MSEPTPLDPAELATRARIRTTANSRADSAAQISAFAAALNELVETALDSEEPWVLPDKARMRGARSASLRVLKVFTDQQQQLDTTLVSAVALLADYCSSLESRIDELTSRIDALEAGSRDDGADR